MISFNCGKSPSNAPQAPSVAILAAGNATRGKVANAPAIRNEKITNNFMFTLELLANLLKYRVILIQNNRSFIYTKTIVNKFSERKWTWTDMPLDRAPVLNIELPIKWPWSHRLGSVLWRVISCIRKRKFTYPHVLMTVSQETDNLIALSNNL